MRRKNKVWGLVFVFIFVGSMIGWAENLTGTVSGVVELKGRVDFSSVTVSIGTLTTFTDRNGKFSFPNIEIGTHTIEVTKSGYVSEHLGLTVNVDTTAAVNFVLYLTTTTQIQYFPNSSTFLLKVYDSGCFLQRTMVLNNKDIKPGGFALSWDGKNDRGVRVNDGEYIAEIMAIFDKYKKVQRKNFTISIPKH